MQFPARACSGCWCPALNVPQKARPRPLEILSLTHRNDEKRSVTPLLLCGSLAQQREHAGSQPGCPGCKSLTVHYPARGLSGLIHYLRRQVNKHGQEDIYAETY